MHLVLVNCLESLSLPRISVVRLTDSPDMTIAFIVDVQQQLLGPAKFLMYDSLG